MTQVEAAAAEVHSELKAEHGNAAQQPLRGKPNLSRAERIASIVAGSVLISRGVRVRSPLGLGMAMLGGAIIWRGASGHCAVKKALSGKSASEASESDHDWESASATVNVNRPVSDVYQYLRAPERLRSLANVVIAGDAVGSADLQSLELELTKELSNELIAWKAHRAGNPGVAGSIHLQLAPGTRGTDLTVALEYDLSGRRLRLGLSRLFGKDPQTSLERTLRQTKRTLEAGESPTTAGQPSGRSAEKSRAERAGTV